jgi:ArsR family transcriptional regulator
MVAFIRMNEYTGGVLPQDELRPAGGEPPRPRGEGVDPATRWELYRLLADPVRPRLLALASVHELGVGELAELLGEPQPKISRHAAALRDAEVLTARKQGTWTLIQLRPGATADPVLADAVAAGMAACRADGTLDRVAEVIRARDAATREFFARARGKELKVGMPPEAAAYLRALSPLIANRKLAIDVGTGDGALLEVLAPVFDRVVAVDRSEVQLALAQDRAARRAFGNVTFVQGEIEGPELAAVADEVGEADAVFASRVLHHAAVPERAFEALARLARPGLVGEPGRGSPNPSGRDVRGGAVVVLDYEHHDDQRMRDEEADLWLGFDPEELARLGASAGLVDGKVTRLPAAWQGEGPDKHLGWQLYVGFRR